MSRSQATKLGQSGRLWLRWVVAMGALAASLVQTGCGPLGGGPALRPNVLVVLIDALRADRLGVNGYPLPTTPEIDRLAGEGVNFTKAFSHSTWTKPSIATLFTSLYPEQHGLDRVAVEAVGGLSTDSLDGQFVTLAERFQQAGYSTGAVINQVHLQQKFGFDQGFDLFVAERGRVAPQLNRRLIRWLETLEPGKPFFAYLHYLDPHWPYRQRLSERAPPLGPTAMEQEPPGSAERIDQWRERVTEESDWEALRTRYDQEVAYVDRAVGEIAENLRRLGRFEDTLIVVTSDHGEGFLEHGELVHGFAPYEEVIHVPLVIRLPEPLRARTGNLEPLVGLIDLAPTLYDLAGLQPTGQEEGRSLAPVIRGGRLGERPVFAQGDGWSAVRSARHKLMTGPEEERLFFALEEDPGELSPVTGACTGPCESLARQLAAFLDHMERTRYSGEGGQIRLDEDEIEDLRALGYLD